WRSFWASRRSRRRVWDRAQLRDMVVFRRSDARDFPLPLLPDTGHLLFPEGVQDGNYFLARGVTVVIEHGDHIHVQDTGMIEYRYAGGEPLPDDPGCFRVKGACVLVAVFPVPVAGHGDVQGTAEAVAVDRCAGMGLRGENGQVALIPAIQAEDFLGGGGDDCVVVHVLLRIPDLLTARCCLLMHVHPEGLEPPAS